MNQQRLRIALLAIPPALIAISGLYLVGQAANVPLTGCEEADPNHPVMPAYVLLGWSVLALVAGRLAPRLHPQPQQARAKQVSDIAGILAIMLFFASISTALIYEAVGVRESHDRGQVVLSQIAELEPITHYMRCAIYYDLQHNPVHFSIWSYLTAGFVTYLIGHWLWAVLPSRAPVLLDEPLPKHWSAVFVWIAGAVTILIVAGFVWAASAILNGWIAETAFLLQQPIGNVPVTGTSFRDGIRIVIGFVFGALLVLSLLDWFFALKRWPSIGLRLQQWSRVNPWFVFFLLLIAGALLAHFMANPIHYPGARTPA